jgi:hypothetical protein
MACSSPGCSCDAFYASLGDFGMQRRCRLCGSTWLDQDPAPALAAASALDAPMVRTTPRARSETATTTNAVADVVTMARQRLAEVRNEAAHLELRLAVLRTEETMLAAMVRAADDVAAPDPCQN